LRRHKDDRAMAKLPDDKVSESEENAAALRPRAEIARWTHQEPCAEAAANSPEISLYLSLHCPRCGQFAAFDSQGGPRRCLLEAAPLHAYLLDRSHHSHNH
jgi:hypothetical protein